MQQIWQSLMQRGDYGNVTVASNVVHQENSQMADVLSHKGPMSLQNTTELHDSAVKEVCFSTQGHSPRGPNVGLVRAAEGQQL